VATPSRLTDCSSEDIDLFTTMDAEASSA